MLQTVTPHVATSKTTKFRAIAATAGAYLLPASAWAQDNVPPALPTEVPPVATAMLPHDLSPWGMFMSASPVVQAVMTGLALASVATWTIFLAKSVELSKAKRQARAAQAALEQARSLTQAAEAIGFEKSPATAFLRAVIAEAHQSADAPSLDGLKERAASRLERIEAAEGRRMMRGTGILASIGSTAPFVGLFGTVWGIMTSFVGIAKTQTTNLAVVAPGIAEALLATAIGLVAAIPAVVIYNAFARSIGGYRAQLGDASAAVQRLLSRDMDRRALPRMSSKAAE
ncbi:tonB-system energizer ExbB [Azospirillum canadense]|uniref:tonB-system energizer ExbB n=1 Tax=Azospirillum canadense TaxID=403962 RepID=UPI002226E3F7|nr:tonB-system energizer ExbB [Azospirillum canadense]MCW2238533.1 biopolymer transport protein ExbB [Azospirillum canadense]